MQFARVFGIVRDKEVNMRNKGGDSKVKECQRTQRADSETEKLLREKIPGVCKAKYADYREIVARIEAAGKMEADLDLLTRPR